VKDSRVAEIVWLALIAVLVGAGGNIVLASLDAHRPFAAVVLGLAVVAALLAVRRTIVANAPTARRDVTRVGTYLVAAIFAFTAIVLHVHWAIGASIAAVEVAIVFDIVNIAARPKASGGEETG
jgi:hypothetical protein